MWTTVDSLAQTVDTEYLSTVPTVMLYPQHTQNTCQLLQDAQLSQRDCAAGCCGLASRDVTVSIERL